MKRNKKSNSRLLIIALVTSIAGLALLLTGFAASDTNFVSVDPSRGEGTITHNSDDASGGSYVEFAQNNNTSSSDWPTFAQMDITKSYASNTNISTTGQPGSMRIVCTISHFNYDDPIVAPGQRGAAHLHMFFGNTLTDYSSTNKSLRETGDGTCAGGEVNRTAYWMPAVIDRNNNARVAQYSEIYYKSGLAHGTKIHPMPEGLVMIEGNAVANSEGENDGKYKWECGSPIMSGSGKASKLIPNCSAGETLRLTMIFPQCWDGTNLNSPDHSSHMTHPTFDTDIRRGVCPGSHPVTIPEITYNVYFNNTDQSTDGWYLSSDRSGGKSLPGGTTTHADWFGAWHPTILDTFINECNNQEHDCKGGTISPTKRLIPLLVPGLSPGDIYNSNVAPDSVPVGSISR